MTTYIEAIQNNLKMRLATVGITRHDARAGLVIQEAPKHPNASKRKGPRLDKVSSAPAKDKSGISKRTGPAIIGFTIRKASNGNG